MSNKLPRYVETINFVRLPNRQRVILPDERDLAIKKLEVDNLEKSLKRFEEEPTPPEITVAQKALATLDPAKAEYVRNDLLLADWTKARINERRQLQQLLWLAKETLQKMLNIVDGKDTLAGTRECEHYAMREFSHKERLKADDDHTTINPDTNARTLDRNARNLDLLGKALLGRFIGENPNGMIADSEIDPIADPSDELGDRITTLLIERMWAVNDMDPSLVPYFR